MERKNVAETMQEWVDARLGRRSDIVAYGPGWVAGDMSTAALFMEHARATRSLITAADGDDERQAWEAALRAVCNELGQRIDAARFDGQEKS